MFPKLSRRELAATLVVSSAAASAQTDSPPDLLREARQDNKRASQALSSFKIGIEVEPAFQFKA